MLKKMLIAAGLLSFVSVCAHAESMVITEATVINNTLTNITTNSGNGGAITNNGYNLTINADISNNVLQNTVGQAVFGGGIYQSGGNLTINDGVKFDNNTVTSRSQTYENWDGVDSASGGAIFVTGDFNVKTNGTVTFSNNKAIAMGTDDQSNGGAICAQGSSPSASIAFNNVNFNTNSSATRGGAIYNGDTDITIDGKGIFNGNTSRSGGAVYLLDVTGNTKFTTGTGSEFTNNTATSAGGAITNYDGILNVGQNNKFSGNKATWGGAIYNSMWQSGAVTNIEGGTTFTNNSATDNGGAIYNGNATVNIDTTAGNVTFSNNTALQGADIYLDGETSNLVITGTNANNKVSFGSTNSIAGNGNITHQSAGTFELLNNQDTSSFTGTYTQTDGKTLLNNSTMFNKFNISAGVLELTNNSTATIDGNDRKFSGSGLNILSSTLNLTTTIDKNININIDQNGTVNLSNNAALTISSGDSWKGTINSNEGNLIVDNYVDTATYTQTNGQLTLQNGSNLTLKDNKSVISSGDININGNSTLNISNGAQISGTANTTVTSGSNLNINGGTLNSTGKTDLQTGSILNIANGGNVTLNATDNWKGTINSNEGNLTVNNYVGTATYTQTNGQLTLQNGSNLTLKDNKSVISSGDININGNSTLNISNGAQISGTANTTVTSGSNLNINGGTLNSTGKTDLQTGSILNIANGGNVTLNATDSWKGTINLGGSNTSTLTVNTDGSNIDALHAETGNLIIGDVNLAINNGSYIKKEVALLTNGNIQISNGGIVYIDNNDVIGESAKITLNDGGILYCENSEANAHINANSGIFNLLSGSKLTINADSKIADTVALNIHNGATLNLTENSKLNLDSQDKWNGHIVNSNGTINADGVANTSGSLKQADGQFNLSSSAINLNNNSTFTGGEINIKNNSTLTVTNTELTGGDMTIDANSAFIVKSAKDAEFSLDSLTATGIGRARTAESAPLVDVMNYQFNTANIGTLNLENQANFNIDILARSTQRNIVDKFIVGNLTGDNTIRINDWTLNGDIYGYDAPIDRNVKLGDIFVDADGKQLEATIETTDKTTFTPIGWYQLNKGISAGNYTLNLVKLNPQVFRGQVATVSQWMNQLSIDDMLFTHSMVLPSFKEPDGGKMANNYAAADTVFAPYQYSRKDGGLWYKMYGTFEHLQMNNGLKHVGNNSYGTLIGADFGLKELKNGWKFMPTAYVGYNGAHQYWSNVSQYQNGGQAGFLGTWYKNNFIVGALAYGGVYGNSMDVFGHTDETFNYFAGTATKASYNIKVHRDFVIQPNLMASYNYFGQQNWHTNFGQMGMMSGMLHGVNIAPGVNFIWERETFSAYLTLQYMYNVNGASGGRAGNVNLPHLAMDRGYIQYGIGFTKKFSDRASGYLQAVLRNAGRTGVGFQAGFIIRLGK